MYRVSSFLIVLCIICLSSAATPAKILNLDKGWALDLPVKSEDGPNGCKGSLHCELQGEDLLNFEGNEWFKKGNESVVFTVPENGAGSGNGAVRTELKNGCNTEHGKKWDPYDGDEHWLNVSQVVNFLTDEKRLTICQMHGWGTDSAHDIIKVQWKGDHIQVEIRDGPVTPLGKVEIGDKFKVHIRIKHGEARFWFKGNEIKDARFEFTGKWKKYIGKCGVWHAGGYSPGTKDKKQKAQVTLYKLSIS